MAFTLKGVAYITGAGSGIGQAAAYALARQGVRSFALLDRNPVTNTSAELKKNYSDIAIKELEVVVTDEKAVDDSIAQTVQEFGRIDYAFNNAGVAGAVNPTDQVEREDFERVLSINTTAVWICQRAEIRQMLKQEKLSNSDRSFRGSIVNTASMFGVIGPSSNVPATAYATSKHAVVGMTKADASFYASHGIKINAICPGYVATPLIVHPDNEANSWLDRECEKVPLKRLATTEEIGDCVAFLYSEASSFMIGASMVVDGGFSIH